MKTIIYLIRHSKPNENVRFARFLNEKKLNNKKRLSEEGIQIAASNLNNPIYKNVDYIYSSKYLRAKQTAEILSKIINKPITYDKRFNERFHGKGITNDFEKNQFYDENHKLKEGESQIEVRARMLEGLDEILKEHQGKTIAIFTHSTAVTFLLKKWCDIEYLKEYKFNNKIFFEGKWDYAQTFKLEFENNELINIEYINNNPNKIEIGLLCEDNLEKCKKILEENNIELYWATIAKDIYYTNINIEELKTKDGETIKDSCIRIRLNRSLKENSKYKIVRVQNYKNYLNVFSNKNYSINKLEQIEKTLIENGFLKVIETTKTDYQYLNGYLQLQEVENLGLIIYYYNPKYFFETSEKQKELLYNDLEKIGFTFKEKLSIDRLKTLINNKICYEEEK